MWRSFVLLAPLVLSLRPVVAHRSLPPGVTCSSQFNSSETALVVPNPGISWASYRILTCDAPVFWLSAEDVVVGQNLSFTVTIPVIDRFADVRVHVLVIGPGLPSLSSEDEALVPAEALAAISASEGAVLYVAPEDQSSCAHLYSEMMTMASDVTDGRCHFHEPYGDTHTWVVLDDMLTAVGAGTYRFAVFSAGTTAKLSFACCDWPEDFTTPFPIPEADCPFCGTEADFAFHSALFYETKNMAEFGGFPAFENCSDVTSPQMPNASTQCPDETVEPGTGEPAPASCFLGCSGEECHSHNVFGECTYTMRWVTPKPLMSEREVTSLILFKGESVLFESAGHLWPHNVAEMASATHLENCDFEGSTQILTVEEVQAGTSVTFNEAGVFYYACEITGHCLLGQKLVVEVKDASEGLKCHSHGEDHPDDGDLSCSAEEVHAYVIESADYGAGADECSEFCTMPIALDMMVGAQNGTCQSAGYPAEVREVTVQPEGSPAEMLVVVYGREEVCHCHSYEQIYCNSSGDALYDEHIEEIETHCQGVVDGSDETCPYRCFQPLEVLHLHYMECSTRDKNALYEQIEETGMCHMAARAPSGTDCDGTDGSQSSEQTTPAPTNQMPALTSGLKVSATVAYSVPGIVMIAALLTQ
mmetsp:Transcript_54530/g.100920  ORF Transcript_54530/g.100920 Transcript_54530/m.100920 type:complete len:645 (+) Transcript_54530:53-1987(+)